MAPTTKPEAARAARDLKGREAQHLAKEIQDRLAADNPPTVAHMRRKIAALKQGWTAFAEQHISLSNFLTGGGGCRALLKCFQLQPQSLYLGRTP